MASVRGTPPWPSLCSRVAKEPASEPPAAPTARGAGRRGSVPPPAPVRKAVLVGWAGAGGGPSGWQPLGVLTAGACLHPSGFLLGSGGVSSRFLRGRLRGLIALSPLDPDPVSPCVLIVSERAPSQPPSLAASPRPAWLRALVPASAASCTPPPACGLPAFHLAQSFSLHGPQTGFSCVGGVCHLCGVLTGACFMHASL